ncbi:MAG: hypothetical protein RMJ53_09920 [Chitinophagales bacterium]|nr:hypothetical protein [Chitinophagales bacterium]
MKEITTGFVNAQLVETQIISKYAFHYLKTLFENVQVQKGSITAEFAKILGIRDKYNAKNRDKHTHHTIDAFVLSLIPDSGRLKSILEKNAEIEELNKLNEFASHDERSHNLSRIETLNRELQQLLIESRIPINSLHKIIQKIENTTIAITPTREKIFATAKKKIRKGKLKGKYAMGDVVRGQLHKESFYGKIKLVQRDEAGKPLRDEKGEWVWLKDGEEEYAFVKRVPVDENLQIEKIIDPVIRNIFENAVKEKSLKEMKKEGGLLYTHPKTGKTKRIRHVRCFQKPTELLEIKEQSHKSKHDYKNVYYADNAENIYYALYEDENGKRTFEMLNLFDAIKIKHTNPVQKPEDYFEPVKEVGRGKNKTQAKLKAVLTQKKKVIIYNVKEDIKNIDLSTLSKRIYNIKGFEKDGRVIIQHNLEARKDEKIRKEMDSEINYDKPAPLLRLSVGNLNFAVEDRDFELKPDGEIIWKV